MLSFRHLLNNRLRAVNCPSEIIDQIGSLPKGFVGGGYGKGLKQEDLANVPNKTANVQPAVFR